MEVSSKFDKDNSYLLLILPYIMMANLLQKLPSILNRGGIFGFWTNRSVRNHPLANGLILS